MDDQEDNESHHSIYRNITISPDDNMQSCISSIESHMLTLNSIVNKISSHNKYMEGSMDNVHYAIIKSHMLEFNNIINKMSTVTKNVGVISEDTNEENCSLINKLDKPESSNVVKKNACMAINIMMDNTDNNVQDSSSNMSESERIFGILSSFKKKIILKATEPYEQSLNLNVTNNKPESMTVIVKKNSHVTVNISVTRDYKNVQDFNFLKNIKVERTDDNMQSNNTVNEISSLNKNIKVERTDDNMQSNNTVNEISSLNKNNNVNSVESCSLIREPRSSEPNNVVSVMASPNTNIEEEHINVNINMQDCSSNVKSHTSSSDISSLNKCENSKRRKDTDKILKKTVPKAIQNISIKDKTVQKTKDKTVQKTKDKTVQETKDKTVQMTKDLSCESTDNLVNTTNLREKEQFICNYCNKSYANKYYLLTHFKIHNGEKLHKCHVCPKSFTRKFTLENHIKIHTGERPFDCNDCDKSFTTKSKLNYHINRHLNKNYFKCTICSESFAHSYSLSIHLKMHNGEKPPTCQTCDKTFKKESSLQIHQRIHTGEKLYSCNICDKSFIYPNSLQIHLNTHNGIKPYKCHVCDKAFGEKATLTKHIIIHSGDKPYKCTFDGCNSAFNQKCCLDRHSRTHSTGSIKCK